MVIDKIQIILTYSIQSAYEGEMVEVKHGNGLVTSFDRSIQNAS